MEEQLKKEPVSRPALELPPVKFLPLEYLHKASCEGDVELVRFLLASCIKGEHSTNLPHSELSDVDETISQTASEQLKRLEGLLLGKDAMGRTALHKACYFKRREVVAELLAFGEILRSLRQKAMMDLQEEEAKDTDDQGIAEKGPLTKNDLTLADCIDYELLTPLHYAVYGGDLECVKLLLALRLGKTVMLSAEENLILSKEVQSDILNKTSSLSKHFVIMVGKMLGVAPSHDGLQVWAFKD